VQDRGPKLRAPPFVLIQENAANSAPPLNNSTIEQASLSKTYGKDERARRARHLPQPYRLVWAVVYLRSWALGSVVHLAANFRTRWYEWRQQYGTTFGNLRIGRGVRAPNQTQYEVLQNLQNLESRGKHRSLSARPNTCY
jgi:hypothetical protein